MVCLARQIVNVAYLAWSQRAEAPLSCGVTVSSVAQRYSYYEYYNTRYTLSASECLARDIHIIDY